MNQWFAYMYLDLNIELLVFFSNYRLILFSLYLLFRIDMCLSCREKWYTYVGYDERGSFLACLGAFGLALLLARPGIEDWTHA